MVEQVPSSFSLPPPDELYSAVNSCRLLVFLEETPNSNLYRQVVFNSEEFKTVSLQIGSFMGQEGSRQVVQLKLSEGTFRLPDVPQIVNDA